MSWMIVASIVAALVVTTAVIWFRWMEARHEHAFAEQKKRLNSGELDPVTARTATPGLARWRLSLTVR